MAAQIAGINIIKLYSQSTAAAVNFMKDVENGNALIIDLGASHIEASIANFNDNNITMKTVCRNMNFGGNTIDSRIAEIIIQKFKKKYPNEKPETNEHSMLLLKEQAMNANNVLQFVNTYNVVIPNFFNRHDLNEEIHKYEVDSMCEDLIEATEHLVEECLEIASLEFEDVGYLFLIGRNFQVNCISDYLQDYFESEINIIVSPPESVLFGAVRMYNIQKENEGIHISEVLSESIGVLGINNQISHYFTKGTNFPITKSLIFATITENQEAVKFKLLQGNDSEYNISKNSHKTFGEYMFALPPRTAEGTTIMVEMSFDIYGDFSFTAKLGDTILENQLN